MKFFKDHSYDIVKLFVNQIGIAIFSMAIFTAASIAIPQTSVWASRVDVALSIASTAFYLVLIYMATWEIGAKDAISIEYGKMEKMPLKGTLMGLFANVPNFLITGLAIVFMSITVFGGPEWGKNVFAVFTLFFTFLESMFMGVVTNIFPITEGAPDAAVNAAYLCRAILYFVAPLISITTTTFGYLMGSNNKRIFPKAQTKKHE